MDVKYRIRRRTTPWQHFLGLLEQRFATARA
jgi:hypothetical protein